MNKGNSSSLSQQVAKQRRMDIRKGGSLARAPQTTIRRINDAGCDVMLKDIRKQTLGHTFLVQTIASSPVPYQDPQQTLLVGDER